MEKRAQVKKDLIDQLEASGIYGSHYLDMVDKYMHFWDLHAQLNGVIKKHGSVVPSTNGFKMNPAIEARNKNNSQMLKILTTLGLKAPNSPSLGDDDDEDM